MRISLAWLIARILCTVRISGNYHQLPALHAVKSQGKHGGKKGHRGQIQQAAFPFGRLEPALRIDTAIVGLQSGDTAVNRPFLGGRL